MRNTPVVARLTYPIILKYSGWSLIASSFLFSYLAYFLFLSEFVKPIEGLVDGATGGSMLISWSLYFLGTLLVYLEKTVTESGPRKFLMYNFAFLVVHMTGVFLFSFLFPDLSSSIWP